MTGTLSIVGFGLSTIGPGAFLGFALAEALALFGLVLAFVL
jgi:F-type H+-transporting ATPase subunit c